MKRAGAGISNDLDLAEQSTVIEANRSWLRLGLWDFWNYRELLYFLVWKDIKVRYKQTFLGAAWAVLQPLLTVLVFTVFFNRFAGIQSGEIPYPVFSLLGVLPWAFFSHGLTTASNSLVGSANLVTKVYFPRVLLPTAAVLAGLVDLAISFVVLLVFVAIYGVSLGTSIFAMPLMLALVFVTTFGIGTFLAALNVQFRDVRYLVPFGVQIWLFVSPVIYPASDIVERLEARHLPGWLYGLNPMVGVIEGFRWAVVGTGEPPTELLLTSFTISLTLLVFSLALFRCMERRFADIV